jgi:hypothetical protein
MALRPFRSEQTCNYIIQYNIAYYVVLIHIISWLQLLIQILIHLPTDILYVQPLPQEVYQRILGFLNQTEAMHLELVLGDLLSVNLSSIFPCLHLLHRNTYPKNLKIRRNYKYFIWPYYNICI